MALVHRLAANARLQLVSRALRACSQPKGHSDLVRIGSDYGGWWLPASLGWWEASVDIIKMDIEGAQYAVIDRLVFEGPRLLQRHGCPRLAADAPTRLSG